MKLLRHTSRQERSISEIEKVLESGRHILSFGKMLRSMFTGKGLCDTKYPGLEKHLTHATEYLDEEGRMAPWKAIILDKIIQQAGSQNAALLEAQVRRPEDKTEVEGRHAVLSYFEDVPEPEKEHTINKFKVAILEELQVLEDISNSSRSNAYFSGMVQAFITGAEHKARVSASKSGEDFEHKIDAMGDLFAQIFQRAFLDSVAKTKGTISDDSAAFKALIGELLCSTVEDAYNEMREFLNVVNTDDNSEEMSETFYAKIVGGVRLPSDLFAPIDEAA